MKLKEKFIKESCDIRYQVLEPAKFEKIADDYASEVLEYYHNNLFFIELKEGEAKEILKHIKKQKGL